ncbi:MAG TPA: N-acetylmuramoyl-L-alanine amidase [Bryobacteraceae bacterium]|jgi:N-acetylmuramoyl-L-alanine amidase|nr:N-acetylmuramoyl-L-alanine amidase [Bryobacteraceae bacterium]
MFRLPRWTVPSSAILFCAVLAAQIQAPPHEVPPHIEAIRFWSFGDVTRVAIETDGDYKLQHDQIENPARLYFDLNGLRPPSVQHRGVDTIHVGDHLVKQIRVAEVNPGTTRIVVDLTGPVEYTCSQLVNPDRLMIEVRPKSPSAHTPLSLVPSMTGAQVIAPPAAEPIPNPPPIVATANTGSPSPDLDAVADSTRNAHLPPPAAISRAKTIPPITEDAEDPNPNLATIPQTAVSRTGVPEIASPAKIAAGGDPSLIRVFGLKLGRVVIDAGHGGHDTGTVGPHGLMEKDLVLDVALRLGGMIQRQLGAQVVYTRSSDVFIPLEERTRIANEEKADLFISIHANSSPVSSATGVETYYFNFSSDRNGLDLATRENATASSSISDLNDLLHKAVLGAKLEESKDFAQKIQTSLWTMSVKMNSRSRDRGVRRAPFLVLIGATMPSILAEIGFVSNPHDEGLLKKSEQRQKIADALFRGVSQYAASLSHVQMARVSN